MRGIYGTVRAANINPELDVDILYYYRPTRSTTSDDFPTFMSLDTSYLVKAEDEGGTILGLFNLELPLDKFNKKGIYTIYIRPKELNVTIRDVSVLAAYPDVKGVIFDTGDLNGDDDLTGYRIEYFDGQERSETVRLITSSHLCEAVLANVADGFPQETRYRLTDTSSNYLFCTVTPSTATSYKSNYAPYIGKPNEKVVLINTKFDPIMLEIEMVEHDDDTISYMIEGDQVRNRDNAIITTYNDDREIYKQQDYYTVKNELGVPLYDVKQKRENIDGSQAYDNVINNTQE